MSGGMRDQMPLCAAFVDELRDAFGKEEIDNVIRRGLRPDCKPDERFFASEGGVVLGQPSPPPAVSFTLDQLQLSSPPELVVKQRGGR